MEYDLPKKPKKGKCLYFLAWIGYCKKDCDSEVKYCGEHIVVKCRECGEQATHECPSASSLVCGVPLCRKTRCRKAHDIKFGH